MSAQQAKLPGTWTAPARPSKPERKPIPELEVARVSSSHRGLIRLALATGFLSGLDLLAPTGVAQVTHMILAIAFVLIVAANRQMFPGGFVALFYALLVASVVSIAMTATTFGEVGDRVLASIARIALAVFILAAYHSAFVLAGRSVQALFREYLKVATFFALLGVVQEVVFLVAHVNIFGFLLTGAKDYGSYLGVSGLSVEPAFYACALLPAAGYYVVQFVGGLRLTRAAILTIGAVVLSTSAVGYLGLFAAAVIAMLAGMRASRAWVLVISLPLVILAANWMLQLDFIQLRIDDSLRLLRGGTAVGSGTNLSSYSLAVNAEMAFQSLRDNYGFGAGFGLYGTVFDHYITGHAMPVDRDQLPGRGSATSFLFRLIGELGVLGIILSAWIVKAFIRPIRQGGINGSVAVAALATFSVILLRMGEYYDNGVLFVVLLAVLLRREARAAAGGQETAA